MIVRQMVHGHPVAEDEVVVSIEKISGYDEIIHPYYEYKFDGEGFIALKATNNNEADQSIEVQFGPFLTNLSKPCCKHYTICFVSVCKDRLSCHEHVVVQHYQTSINH